MNRKIYYLLGILIAGSLFFLLVYGLFFASDPAAIPSAQLNQKARPFEVTTFDGQKLSLEQFRGRPVVLNFWASWCVSCRREAHILEVAHQKYTPRGAVFIGIAFNDKRENSLAFIRQYRKTYYLGPDDNTGTISLDYGVTAAPETFFIGKQGIIENKILGAVTRDAIENFLERQLQ